MNIELNLTKINGIYNQSGRLISRKRTSVANDTEALEEVIKFMNDNNDIINAAVTDKAFISQLALMKSMSISDFNCVRYRLAMSGLDIKVFEISDEAPGTDGVEEGKVEYNIIDNFDYSSSFIPFCTKIIMNSDTYKLSDLYSQINQMYNLFESSVFSSMNSPIKNDISVMESQETLFGNVPVALTQHANSILEFIGINVFAMTN